MPRHRTGTLVAPGADGLWRCRVTKEKADGSTWRPFYSLGTADKSHARRKLVRVNDLLARGIDPFDATDAVGAPERVREYVEAWLSAREARGISKARWERSYFKNHIVEAIGNLPLEDVTPAHVRFILEEAAAKGLKHATVGEVRGVLHRIFDEAWRAELIESNPVARVKRPPCREIRKERSILTDEEFAQFVACEHVDLELRMMGLVARCEGGMRTGDLHKWDWTMIDRVDFAECFIPRAKTRRPQALAIPAVLAPFLRAWWERAGKPEAGRVFPVRIGKRAGQEKKTNSHAKRLRSALMRAGVFRLKPLEVPETGKGQANGSRQGGDGHQARPRSARPALLRDRGQPAGRLPLVPACVQHGARRGGRQRPARDAPGVALRSAGASPLRDAHEGDAADPGRGAAATARRTAAGEAHAASNRLNRRRFEGGGRAAFQNPE